MLTRESGEEVEVTQWETFRRSSGNEHDPRPQWVGERPYKLTLADETEVAETEDGHFWIPSTGERLHRPIEI